MTCPDGLCKPRPNRALFVALAIAAVSTGVGLLSSYQLSSIVPPDAVGSKEGKETAEGGDG